MVADPPVRAALHETVYLASLDARITAGPAEVLKPALTRLLTSENPIACDTETFGLGTDARRLKCVQFATAHEAVVADPRDPAQADLIRMMFTAAPALTFHNSAFDVPNLSINGLIGIADIKKISDTLIYARLAHPDVMVRKSLDELARRYLGLVKQETIKDAFRRLGLTIREGFRHLDINAPQYLFGAAIDTVVTARLLQPLKIAAVRTLTEHPFREGVAGADLVALVEREQIINRTLLRRSCRGLRIDLEFLDRFQAMYAAERSTAEAELEVFGVRPGNANDLIRVLQHELPLDHPRTPTGKPSTTAAHLERLHHPLAKLFIRAKQIAKVQDDYLQKVTDLAIWHPGDDFAPRIHPVMNLLAATTGRASMGDPPLHQFPDAARGIILADQGDSMTSIDWSQIEPVLAANLAGDLDILRGYENGTSDLYTALAELASIPRKTAKVVLLAQMYGEGIAKLAADLAVDEDTARSYREHIFTAMPKVAAMLGRLRASGKRHRKIPTLSGRILDIPMGRGFDGQPPSVASHKAVNYTVQGGAYDLLAEALVRIEAAGLGDAVYLTMHDEVVVSTAAALDIAAIMATPPLRLCTLAGRTPVLRTDSADLGERWAGA